MLLLEHEMLARKMAPCLNAGGELVNILSVRWALKDRSMRKWPEARNARSE